MSAAKNKKQIVKKTPKQMLLPVSSCRKIVKSITPTLRSLEKYYPRQAGKHFLDPLTQAAIKDCQNMKSRAALSKALRRWMHLKHKKVGVLISATSKPELENSWIRQGIEHALERHLPKHVPVDVKYYLSEKNLIGTYKAIAKMVFESQISMMIIGPGTIENSAAAAIANRLLIPTLLMTSKPSLAANRPWVYQVFPPIDRMAEGLVQELNFRNAQTISLLQPMDGSQDRLIETMNHLLQQNPNLDIKIHPYRYGDYTSMNIAIEHALGIDSAPDSEQFREAYELERQRAGEEGIPFSTKNIVLPPRRHLDYLFIPDSTSSIRYFAKLLKYHQAEGVKLFGHIEWRDSRLMQPWDPALNKGFFVDYVGSYRTLPDYLTPSGMIADVFAESEEVVAVDKMVLGFRAGQAALLAMKNLQKPLRIQLRRGLLNIKDESPFYFDEGPVFTKSRVSQWPVFVFSIHDGTLLPARKLRFTNLSTAAKSP